MAKRPLVVVGRFPDRMWISNNKCYTSPRRLLCNFYSMYIFQNVAAGRSSDLCDNGELMKAVVEVCWTRSMHVSVKCKNWTGEVKTKDAVHKT